MSTNPEGLFDEAVAEVESEDTVYELREALRKARDKIRRLKVNSEAVAEAAMEGARSAVLAQPRTPVVPYKTKSRKGQGRAEDALWHMTDWQGSKKTSSYNSEVMRVRANRFVTKALRITEIQRADHPVKRCTIAFGGDMIEGLFNFPTQPYEIDMTLFDQFVSVATLIDEVVRRAAAAYDEIHVVPEWGNHGRLGSKRAAVPRNDNADRMTYELAKSMTRDLPNVSWQDCPEDVQQIQIGNYRALLIHGDEIGRNGFASPMTIVQHANRWRSGAYPWEFRDVYLGHYHTHNSWAMANGEGHVYQSGSMESDNRYAGIGMASTAIPSQRLHFIDPRDGCVTAEYQVYLDK